MGKSIAKGNENVLLARIPDYAFGMSSLEKRRPRKRVTIREVAVKAGVSITTVSHAINEKGSVAEATRARVLAAAEQLGYQADALARGLRNNRIGVVGLVMRPLDALGAYRLEGVDYFTRLAGAAAVEALDRGFCLMLMRDLSTTSVPAIAFAVDGYIVADPIENDPVIELLRQRDIPVVSIGRDIARPDFVDWVGADEAVDIHTVLTHLQEQGASTITLLTGTDRNAWNLGTETAYQSWARAHHMAPVVIHQGESTGEEGGRAVAKALLAGRDPLPEAIYSLTGRHAAGLVEALREAGLRVPHDVMVVAGSDSEQTRNGTPPITSVDLRPELVAHAAVELLQRRLDQDEGCGPSLIQSALLVRQSTQRSKPRRIQ